MGLLRRDNGREAKVSQVEDTGRTSGMLKGLGR